MIQLNPLVVMIMIPIQKMRPAASKDLAKGYISEPGKKHKSIYHQEPKGDDNIDSDQESESIYSQTSNSFGDLDDQDDYKDLEKGYKSEPGKKHESTYHQEPKGDDNIEYDQESESCDSQTSNVE